MSAAYMEVDVQAAVVVVEWEGHCHSWATVAVALLLQQGELEDSLVVVVVVDVVAAAAVAVRHCCPAYPSFSYRPSSSLLIQCVGIVVPCQWYAVALFPTLMNEVSMIMIYDPEIQGV